MWSDILSHNKKRTVNLFITVFILCLDCSAHKPLSTSDNLYFPGLKVQGSSVRYGSVAIERTVYFGSRRLAANPQIESQPALPSSRKTGIALPISLPTYHGFNTVCPSEKENPTLYIFQYRAYKNQTTRQFSEPTESDNRQSHSFTSFPIFKDVIPKRRDHLVVACTIVVLSGRSRPQPSLLFVGIFCFCFVWITKIWRRTDFNIFCFSVHTSQINSMFRSTAI